MESSGAAKGERRWVTQAEFLPRRMPLGNLALPRSPRVHLWYLDLGGLWRALSSVLSNDGGSAVAEGGEMGAQQLRFARRFYLRILLGAYLGVAGKDVGLVRGPRGKPVLDESRHGGELKFSLAKSGQRLLIGVSGSTEVGVDLELEERRPRNARDLARRFFTVREAEAICALNPAERDATFMRTWACKEAVAKASGHGIANRFCRFSIDAGASKPPLVVEDQDHPADGWRLALMAPERGYIAAVAVQQPSLRVEAFRL